MWFRSLGWIQLVQERTGEYFASQLLQIIRSDSIKIDNFFYSSFTVKLLRQTLCYGVSRDQLLCSYKKFYALSYILFNILTEKKH
jgi:hypothetical protein